MAKSISLTVHRNKVESRRKRDLAKDVQSQVEAIIRENDVRAYAFVAIAADGTAYSRWDSGAVMPLVAFPATVAELLHRDIANSDVVDDWKPNLTLKG